jgi:hypothetical protein
MAGTPSSRILHGLPGQEFMLEHKQNEGLILQIRTVIMMMTPGFFGRHSYPVFRGRTRSTRN